jgi:hypothetical protein
MKGFIRQKKAEETEWLAIEEYCVKDKSLLLQLLFFCGILGASFGNWDK